MWCIKRKHKLCVACYYILLPLPPPPLPVHGMNDDVNLRCGCEAHMEMCAASRLLSKVFGRSPPGRTQNNYETMNFDLGENTDFQSDKLNFMRGSAGNRDLLEWQL